MEKSKHKMSKLVFLYAIFLILLVKEINAVGKIIPTRPIQLAIQDSGAITQYQIYFQVDTALPSGYYVSVRIPDFSTIQLQNCFMYFNQIKQWEKTTCSLLPNTSSDTLEQKQTVWVLLPENLEAGVENQIYIQLKSPTNTFSYLGGVFSLKTLKYYKLSENIIFDQNLNFGTVPYETAESSLSLAGIDTGSSLTFSTAINEVNDFSLSFTFKKQVGDAYSGWSQMKIILPFQWTFRKDSKIVLTQNDSGPVIQMDSYDFISPNQLQIIFSTYLYVNTNIGITINNVQNPDNKYGPIELQAFTFPYNKNKAIEKNVSPLKSLETKEVQLDLTIEPGLYMPSDPSQPSTPQSSSLKYASGVRLYKFQEQYIQINIISPQQIPPNYYMQFDFGEQVSVLQGSVYIDNSLKNYDITEDFKYEYKRTATTQTGSDKDLIESFNRYLKITNIGSIQKTLSIKMVMRIYVHNSASINVKVAFNQNSDFSIDGTYKGSISMDTNIEVTPNSAYHDFFAYGVDFKTQTSPEYVKQRDNVAKLEKTTSQADKYQNGIVIQFKPKQAISQMYLFFTQNLSFNWNGNFANQIGSTTQIDVKLLDGPSGGIIEEFPIIDGKVQKRFVEPTDTLKKFTEMKIVYNFILDTTYYILLNNVLISQEKASNGIDRAFDIYAEIKGSSSYYYAILPLVVGTKKSEYFKFSTLVNQAFDLTVSKADDKRSGQPSILNLVNKDSIDLNNILTNINQKRVIIVYAQNSFQHLVEKLDNQDDFPCGGTIDVICKFIAGKTLKNDKKFYYTDWDRVVIFLPDEAIITPFHIAIPDISMPDDLNSYAAYYQVGIGTYDTEKRIYDIFYTQISEYKQLLIGVAPSEADEDERINFDIIGYGGQERDGLEIKVYSTFDHKGNMEITNSIISENYGSAVVLVTDWQLWQDDLSSYKFVNNKYITSSGVNAPLSFQYTSYMGNTHYITVFPLINEEHFILGYTFYLENVLLPYSHMLPEMKIIVTNQGGQINAMRTIVNSGDNKFFNGYLKSSSIKCSDYYIGVKNTDCTFQFQPNIRLQSYSLLYLKLNGLLLSQYSCSIKYYHNLQYYQIDGVSCNIDDLNDLLIINANIKETMPVSAIYYLNIAGIEIEDQSVYSYELQIRDISGDFVIEKSVKIFYPQRQDTQFILIESIHFDHNNFNVITNMYVTFYIPRQPNDNEYVCVSLTESLQKYNQDIARLNIKLFRDWNLEEISIGVYFLNDLMMIELDEISEFYSDFYQLHIYNIKTPEDDENYNQEYFQIYFVRQEDDNVVIQNNQINSQVYPVLNKDYNNQISLELSRFNYQGGYAEFIFEFTTDIQLDYQQYIINILFPVFYSTNVANYSDLQLICKVDNKDSECGTLKNNPYLLQISKVSKTIYAGQTFELSVYGIDGPSKSLSESLTYANDQIFIGLLPNKTYTYYPQYQHIIPPTVSILDATFQNYINIIGVKITNQFIRYSSTHTITFKSSQIISNTGYYIQILFPKEYNLVGLKSQFTCRISQQTQLSGNLINAFTIKEAATGYVQGSLITIKFSTAILNDRYYQIAINGVPTPYETSTVDFNYMKIQIYDAVTNAAIAMSQYYTNTCVPMEIITPSNYLMANSNEIITITQGTFSNNLYLTTSSGSNFGTNIQASGVEDGFKFYPSIFFGYQGKENAEFQLGVDRQTEVKKYTISLDKTEKSSSKTYNMISNLLVNVVDTKIVIPMVKQIRIPYGGCSLPEKIQLPNGPYEELLISQIYDKKTYRSDLFRINQDLSDQYIYFYNGQLNHYFSFCVSESYKTEDLSDEVVVQYKLGGANSESYVLQYSEIICKISSRQKYSTIQSSINIIEKTKTWAQFDIYVTTDGTLFWEIFIVDDYYDDQDPLQLDVIKENLKENNSQLAAFNSHLNYLEIDELDHRVDMEVFYSSNQNQLELSNLMPESIYKMCHYFQDQFNQVSAQSGTCSYFSTYRWQNWIKIKAVFSYEISLIELNNLLCWLSSEAQTYFDHVIESNGYSCSFNDEPELYYQNYIGETFSNTIEENYFYLMPKKNYTGTDPAIQTLTDIFVIGTSEVSSSALTRASTQYGIQFINSLTLESEFSYTTIKNADNGFNTPSLKENYKLSYSYDKDSKLSQIIISDVQLSADGVIYFVLEQKKEYEDLGTNDDDDKMGIKIIYYDSYTPSLEQVLNCQNFYSQPADGCARAILQTGSKAKVTFGNLESNSEYNIYYITTNEYPLRPITTKKQQVKLLTGETINTVFENSQILGIQIVFILIFTIIIFI